MSWQDDHKRRVQKMPAAVREAHGHSIQHRQEVLGSGVCGCFYCCSIFSPETICEWVDEDTVGIGQTAICPKCGIDSVVGDKSGFEISKAFLTEMKTYWF
jgi:hypothetical protein